jgi:hypothetical protein
VREHADPGRDHRGKLGAGHDRDHARGCRAASVAMLLIRACACGERR